MERSLDLTKKESFNKWVLKSMELFNETPYLDNILKVYPFNVESPQRLDKEYRREIIMAHQGRETNKLLELLSSSSKFPYEEPVWYLMNTVKGCAESNPRQMKRISDTLYSMSAEETVFRLESAPKANTQIGPMFTSWLKRSFRGLDINEFKESSKGIFILDASEEEAKRFVQDVLGQALPKRPDLVAKANGQYVIGEAKWIGQPGGNQGKQVEEVLAFCKAQRGKVMRIGIIDGFPWSVENKNGNLINNKEAIMVQESEYDIISALLLEDYLNEFT